LNTWFVLQTVTDVAECHRLLFLQMACEKACKAHLILGGSSPETLQTSHGYVANPLPIVIKQQILRLSASLKGMRGVMEHVRHVAEEIEILNPAIDRAGKRPDNCEYPWEDSSGAVTFDVEFSSLQAGDGACRSDISQTASSFDRAIVRFPLYA